MLHLHRISCKTYFQLQMKCMWYLYIIARQQNFRLCYVRKWKESFYLNNLVFIFVGNPNWSETNILFCLRPEAGIHKHARSWNGAPRPEWNEESGKSQRDEREMSYQNNELFLSRSTPEWRAASRTEGVTDWKTAFCPRVRSSSHSSSRLGDEMKC